MFYIPQIVLFGAAERNVDLNYLKGAHLPTLFICELGVRPALLRICSFHSFYFTIFFYKEEVAYCPVLPQFKKGKKVKPP